jgi:hypothetical protein
MFPLYLTRRQAAKYVRETYGTNCSEKWLAKLAVTGGGPSFWKDGRAVLYTVNAIDSWMSQRRRGPFASTACRQSPEAYCRSIRGLPFTDVDDIDDIADVATDDVHCDGVIFLN